MTRDGSGHYTEMFSFPLVLFQRHVLDRKDGTFVEEKSEEEDDTPIVGYADYRLPFELHTDARTLGLGAVLYQLQGDK